MRTEMLDMANNLFNNWVSGDLVSVPVQYLDNLRGPYKNKPPHFNGLEMDSKQTVIRQHVNQGGVFMLLASPTIILSPNDMAVIVKVPVICLDFKTTLEFRFNCSSNLEQPNMEILNKVFNLFHIVRHSINKQEKHGNAI